jgi:predicted nucleic acid-binding protein
MLVLDSGGVSRLAERTRAAAALIAAFRTEGMWPPLVPTPVLVEALRGDAARDASANRLLKTCEVIEDVSEPLARRAASLRTQAQRGSAVDAIVVAMAEPGGSVVTSDRSDLAALADHADDVVIEGV